LSARARLRPSLERDQESEYVADRNSRYRPLVGSVYATSG